MPLALDQFESHRFEHNANHCELTLYQDSGRQIATCEFSRINNDFFDVSVKLESNQLPEVGLITRMNSRLNKTGGSRSVLNGMKKTKIQKLGCGRQENAMQKLLLASILLIAWTESGFTQSEQADSPDLLAGHSYHGEAFNEGPRQKPYLMDGLGRSKFEISTTVTNAQAFFNQGVDQLHGFWYFEAERSFREVAMLDPECAMAYWGLAMANINNEDRARKFTSQAKEKIANTDRTITLRERRYIEALGRLLRRVYQRQEKTSSGLDEKAGGNRA